MMETGDRRQAFEEAYDELFEPLFRYFFYRLGDRDRAKDLAQEAFMKAWDYERRGGTIQSLKSFLYTTAGNLFKNELRAKRPVASLDEMLEAGHDFSQEETSPEVRADAKLLMERVAALPASLQEVVRLRYLDQLAIKEIAEALGKTETAVSVRLHRALKKLKALYEPTL